MVPETLVKGTVEIAVHVGPIDRDEAGFAKAVKQVFWW
jgi:hypothetical protein